MDVVKKKLNENFINLRIAHRGLHSETVSENSMEAFRLAIERGYAIEIDVHLTRDDDLAVVHDSFLSRVTGKSGVVERLSTEELKITDCATDSAYPCSQTFCGLWTGACLFL